MNNSTIARTLARGIRLSAVAALLTGLLAVTQPAQAADITVTTTTDVLDAAGSCGAITIPSLPGLDGVVSLREAMCAANNNASPDTIQFDIPGCGSGCAIQPTIALPVLTDDDTTIDGYTQDGASPATDTAPATLRVELDGSSIANNNGFNITSSGNVIRGLVINRFSWNGVGIGGSEATGNVIAGNYIGTDSTGFSELGNGLGGIFIGLGAQNNTIGGDEPAERNIISGNYWGGVGIHGSGTTGNTVSGNYIGIAADGLYDCANLFHGVYIYGGAQNNAIGGNTSGERNVISGNSEKGVLIYGDVTTGTVVSGNYIGVDASGLTAVMNNADGVSIAGGARENIIGGAGEGEGNIISGNSYSGVLIEGAGTEANRVSGNFIGVDASGLAVLPNGGNGIAIWSSGRDNLIGGDSEEKRNVISGNNEHGIYIDGGGSNEIVGNYIGLDSSGLAALPNENDGIMIRDSGNNTVGGETFAEMNFISGNEYGIWIEESGATGNWIHGNAIGMAVNGEPLGNGYGGVHISIGAQHNTIGRDEGNNGLGNFIAYNGGDGVDVDTPTAFGNAISHNAIFANGGLGINLTNGSNHDIAPPIILSAPSGPGDVTGTACPGCTVEVFVNEVDDGEGMGYWGSAVADGGGNFTLSVLFLPFPYLTATATDPDDGTSEFSAVFTAEIPVLHAGSSKSVDRETASPGEVMTYTLTLSNTGTSDAVATLTDTLPAEVTWADNASASAGSLTWESENNRLLWNGTVGLSTQVIITYQVTVNAGLPDGETISNVATVDDGAGIVFDIIAPEVTVIAHYLYLPLVLK